jgi:cellulose synthase operon protein C
MKLYLFSNPLGGSGGIMVKLRSKFCSSLLFIACGAMAMSPTGRVYAQSGGEKILLARAQAHLAHGEPELAVQIWQQVLLSDPTCREAILGIAKADMQMGKTEEAQRYEERLRELGISAADVQQIESIPHAQPQSVRLEHARRLAQEGRSAEAVAAYRELFPNGPPAGEIAREFYETEASIPASKGAAIEGLRKLASQFSADPQYTIALGRTLTYDPKTRAEGISILGRVEKSPEAQRAMKQALSWSSAATQVGAPGPSGSPIPAGPVADPLEGSAYRALNSDHLDQAEHEFEALLAKEPNNAKALSGLGYVFMKRGNFAQAQNYLEKARAAGATKVDSTLSTARFWNLMTQAASEQKSGNLKEAIRHYRDALSLKPGSSDAAQALAGAWMQAGNSAEAAAILKHETQQSPADEATWRGLFLAQAEMGDWKGAAATAQRMPKAVEAHLETDPAYLRFLIQAYRALGQSADADREKERALALPFADHGRDLSADQQLQYAELLMAVRRLEPALRLYRQVLVADPQNVHAWSSLIAAEHQLNRDDDAITTVRRMPQSVYDKAQDDTGFLVLLGSIYQSRSQWPSAEKYLERAVAISDPPQPQIQIQLAAVYAAQGKQKEAYAIYKHAVEQNADNVDAWLGLLSLLHQANRDQEALRELDNMPEAAHLILEQNTSFLQTLASIQQGTGQDKASLQTFQLIEQLCRDQQIEEPADVQVQYGWALLKTGDDRRLYSVVTSLANNSSLTDEQQVAFHKMWASWSAREANKAIAAGDLHRGVTILETAAQTFPKDEDIDNALAGAYWKMGQPKKAVAVYATLDMRHATQAQYRGAIGAALAAQDMKLAEAWLQAALNLYQQDPAILQLAAQFEQVRGDSARAKAYYRAALDAMGPESAAGIFSRPEGADAAKPGPNNSSTRQLMQLLAPAGPDPKTSQLPDRGEGGRKADITWRDGREAKARTLGDFAPSDADDREATSNSFTPDNTPGPAAFGPVRRPVVHDQPARKTMTPKTPTLGELGSTPEQPDPYPSTSAPIRRASLQLPSTRAYVQQPPADRQPSSGGRADQQRTQLQDGPATDSSAAEKLQEAAEQLAAPSRDRGQAPPSPVEKFQYQNDSLDNLQNSADVAAPQPYQVASSVLPPLTAPIIANHAPLTPREQVQQQLAVIEGASSPWNGGTSSLDYRSGQAGFDQLAMFSAQAESSAMIGSGVRTTFIVKPVLLDAGTATGDSTFRLGTLAAATTPAFQNAAGIAGEFQLQTANFGARAGTSPRGFLVQNYTGGLYIHPAAAHFSIEFSRDPIMDTQLSFAGLRDQGTATTTTVANPFAHDSSSAGTGNPWGGVISNSAELKVNYGDGMSGWYIQGGGQYLTGLHVPNNQRIDGDGGAYWSAWQSPEYGKLVAGMNFFGMHYERNLRYFTYGQGGYFSPDAYMLAAVPITFLGHYGPRWHYRATGSLGLQAFQEDAAPFFPLDSYLQSSGANLIYPERTSVGANYNVETEAAYAVSDHWFVGAYAAFNNTRDYASDKVGFFLRFLPRSQPINEEVGPTGLFPTQGMRPLQVP